MAKKKRTRVRQPSTNGTQSGSRSQSGRTYNSPRRQKSQAQKQAARKGTNRAPGRPHGQSNSAAEPADSNTGNGAAHLEEDSGVLEMHPNGYGFLRNPSNNYARERSDPFVPANLVEKYRLREGVLIHGQIQHQRKQQGPRLKEVIDIDGLEPERYLDVKPFDSLTPINPEEWLQLETGAEPISARVMDLLTPLGKGQRALIVAPPRSGKTVLLQQISHAVSENHPDIKLIVLLIDERPEEVTEMRRMVSGEVVHSSLDRETESHARLAQLIIERAKRLVEMGQDVFVLLDSITRLARAFNKLSNNNRTMTGGVDIRALDIPKRLFATARAFEEGGSLTIVGTALIDTGSKMDEVIFQEFKGTGNMELVLDRKLADRRIWPAIDIEKSGTRREEKLLDPDWLHAVTMLRRTLGSMNHMEAMEQLRKTLGRFENNAAFIEHITSVRQKA